MSLAERICQYPMRNETAQCTSPPHTHTLLVFDALSTRSGSSWCQRGCMQKYAVLQTIPWLCVVWGLRQKWKFELLFRRHFRLSWKRWNGHSFRILMSWLAVHTWIKMSVTLVHKTRSHAHCIVFASMSRAELTWAGLAPLGLGSRSSVFPALDEESS